MYARICVYMRVYVYVCIRVCVYVCVYMFCSIIFGRSTRAPFQGAYVYIKQPRACLTYLVKLGKTNLVKISKTCNILPLLASSCKEFASKTGSLPSKARILHEKRKKQESFKICKINKILGKTCEET